MDVLIALPRINITSEVAQKYCCVADEVKESRILHGLKDYILNNLIGVLIILPNFLLVECELQLT